MNELKKFSMEYETKLKNLEKKLQNEIIIFNDIIKTVLIENKPTNLPTNKSSKIIDEEMIKDSNNISNNNLTGEKLARGLLKVKPINVNDKKNLKTSNSGQVFCFEDDDSNDYFLDENDNSDKIEEREIDVNNEETSEKKNKDLNMNEINEIEEMNAKYSCSLPQSIPSSFGNRIDKVLIDDKDLDYDNQKLGAANFTQLASSIIQKDGSELFGDRPSRRIPINSIIKSCIDN